MNVAGCSRGTVCSGLVRARQLEHVRVGIYGDYFHLKQTTSNSADIGARVGTGISAHVKIEGEMASDFNQAITQSTTSGSGETRLEESNLLRGQFGPKLEGGDDWARPFLVAKVEFERLSLDARPGHSTVSGARSVCT